MQKFARLCKAAKKSRPENSSADAIDLPPIPPFSEQLEQQSQTLVSSSSFSESLSVARDTSGATAAVSSTTAISSLSSPRVEKSAKLTQNPSPKVGDPLGKLRDRWNSMTGKQRALFVVTNPWFLGAALFFLLVLVLALVKPAFVRRRRKDASEFERPRVDWLLVVGIAGGAALMVPLVPLLWSQIENAILSRRRRP